MEQNNELIGVEINLSPRTIDESYLTAMGAQVEILLQSMFGGGPIGASITGTNSQINAFARAGDDKRPSRPTATLLPYPRWTRQFAKAMPIARASANVIVSSKIPLMS